MLKEEFLEELLRKIEDCAIEVCEWDEGDLIHVLDLLEKLREEIVEIQSNF